MILLFQLSSKDDIVKVTYIGELNEDLSNRWNRVFRK